MDIAPEPAVGRLRMKFPVRDRQLMRFCRWTSEFPRTVPCGPGGTGLDIIVGGDVNSRDSAAGLSESGSRFARECRVVAAGVMADQDVVRLHSDRY